MLSFRMDYRRICGLVTIATIALTLLIVSIDFQPALGTWWDPGWRYRKTITIDHTKVAANLTNFPLLIDLVDADLASKAKSDGSDIAFVGCCGMQLKHEIEYYNGGTGRLLAWVKLLTLSSTGDQALYMYYGNPSASSQQSPPEVWDSNYRMVQHFEETSGTHYDSTANGRNGTAYGGVVQGTSEKIDGADSFDGSDDYIQVTGQDVVSGTSTTVSFWEKNMTIGSGFGAIFDDFAFSSGTPGFLWQFGDSSTTFQIGNVADWNNRLNYAHGGLTDNIWHYFTVTFGAGAITLYMDGVAVATQISSTSIAIDGESALLMRRSDGHYTKGLLDELTVSDTTRSADWIRTCYNSQNNPSTFYKIGSQEEGGAPIVSDPSPMDGATGVSILLTQLLFDLKDSEEDLMSYTATTSPNIGSGSGTNVPNGTYSISVSGLSRSTIYTWHVNATDGIHWTNVTYRFTTETATYFDPSENGWLYRKKITIDHNRVAAYLSNFPMLVDFTDSALGTNAQADGRDILFMDGPGKANKLDHEIERYSGGHLVAWVCVPSLSSVTDTAIYLYYGKSTAPSQENATGVWDSSFMMVQHLKETSGLVHDSTSNGNTGTPVGGVTQNANGKIDGSCWFDGVNDYINFGNVLDITTGGATWSAWIKFDEAKVHRFIGKGEFGILVQWFRDVEGVCELQAGNIGDWSNRVIYQRAQDTNWHYATAIFDDAVSKYRLFLDGELVATGPNSTLPAANSDSFVVGTGYINEAFAFTKGAVDEVEVSSTARSSAWIRTCYNNQYSPSSFSIVGREEQAGAPVVSDPNPTDGATGVSTSLTQLSFSLQDYQNDLMSYTVTTSPNIGGGSGNNVSADVYTIPVSGLAHGTMYTWHVNVTDGTYWANLTFAFTTRPIIMLSNPSPPDGGTRVSYNPTLFITVDHELGYPMNVRFSTNASGTWKEIDTFSNVGNGIYGLVPINMTKRNTTYYWSVYADDTLGHSTTQNYTLTIVDYIAPGPTPIGNSFCCRFGYIRPARETGQYIATWQHADHPGPWASPADTPEFAIYDIEQGWVKTWTPVFNSVNNRSAVFHNSWGYWDDEYHYMDGVGGTTFEIADSSTWEGFQSMNFWDSAYSVGPRQWTNPTPSLYSFNNTNAWIIASDYYSGQWAMKYWPWSKSSGWSAPKTIMATVTSNTLDAGQLLQLNKTTWLLYYADVTQAAIKYAMTVDSGNTWTGPYTRPELTTSSSQCNRVSFARYGDNFYIFLTDSNGDATIYNSTDGIHWANKQIVMRVNGLVHHGTLLHQGALISTTGDLSSGDPGIHYGIVTPIPEMLSYPGMPSDPYPADWVSLPKGTTTTALEVTVHGSQTYNVAFYWADGTFIGEQRLLKEGDRARVQVSVVGRSTLRWYAVARGATYDYCGNQPLATSDEKRTQTFEFQITELPELYSSPTSAKCRKYSEDFSVKIGVTHATNVENLEFEIRYNTTLLNYTSVSWNSWSTGTITANEDSGTLAGSTSGTAFNGTRTLLTLTFRSAYYHMWKSNPGWKNDITALIYIQWANLSIQGKPDLNYVRGGGSNQISVGSDFIYKFSPIQGDVNNDGTVNVFDLRTVAAYYNVKQGDPEWAAASTYDLNSDKIIDIFDIVIVSAKYGYSYP